MNRLWVHVPQVFSEDECAQIKVEYFNQNCSGAKISTPHGFDEMNSVRKTDVAWLGHDSHNDTTRSKLIELIKKYNSSSFGFHIDGFGHGIQIARYSKNHHYDWHIDSGVGTLSQRKLTFVVQLSREDEYDGGDLELKYKSVVQSCPRKMGDGIIFPSFLLHRVSPVLDGVRFSLTAWMTGPAWL